LTPIQKNRRIDGQSTQNKQIGHFGKIPRSAARKGDVVPETIVAAQQKYKRWDRYIKGFN